MTRKSTDLVPAGSEFLLYSAPDGAVKVRVLLKGETAWLTQKGLAELFGVKVPAVTKHLKNIFDSGELGRAATISKMEIVQTEGGREIAREVEFYNLDAIIAVGYRVNSYQATQFRIWATKTLREFIIKGFVLDDERLKQGKTLFGKDYFDELLERIREIRASERRFYQWKGAPHGKIQKSDVAVAKNYLGEEHVKELNRIVSAYLDLAENRAQRGILMKMADWASFLNGFLELSSYPILADKGKVSALEAKLKAEYEVYRKRQDAEYLSDFDRVVEETCRLEGKQGQKALGPSKRGKN
jgi:hypothetical protein